MREDDARRFRITLAASILMRTSPEAVLLHRSALLSAHSSTHHRHTACPSLTLNSAYGVQLPKRSPSPLTFPIGASVKLPPTAPPMILSPLKWPARSVYFWNNNPIFVKAPVETSHAVLGGVVMRAWYMASR